MVNVEELEKEELKEIINGVVNVPKEITIREPNNWWMLWKPRGNWIIPIPCTLNNC